MVSERKQALQYMAGMWGSAVLWQASARSRAVKQVRKVIQW
jgi:hypothetical protein